MLIEVVVLTCIAALWVYVGIAFSKAMDTNSREKFIDYAIVAGIFSFLSMGPFCLIIWVTLCYRSIWLSFNGEP